MNAPVPAQGSLAALCAADGEFRIAARHWTGGLRLDGVGGVQCVRVENGAVVAGEVRAGESGVIALSGPAQAWGRLTAQVPERFWNDVSGPVGMREITLSADPVLYAQYYPAVMRAIELLRPPRPEAAPNETGTAGAFDAPVGRYVHLDLGGQDWRIYFEEAGAGVPLLLQHTAGCHGSQWRHLFENPAITSRFRLIAYDLPFHGKSLPPVGPAWWAEEYRLKGDFLRSIPVTLAKTLGLERPVFMGCSVGGLLALDLALNHADLFDAVISVEGALKIETDFNALGALWRPDVGNEYKARLMNGLMSPTSPAAYRKETSQIYAAGWPPAFLGDLWYYLVDYDLRETAGRIDTSKVGVHILNGEYDSSGTLEHGRAAHAAIAGSTWSAMMGCGHFPMSENPEAFMGYLLPVLDQVLADRELRASA
jgi:pimeloyl-ACP methyl ester carboxylesterase